MKWVFPAAPEKKTKKSVHAFCVFALFKVSHPAYPENRKELDMNRNKFLATTIAPALLASTILFSAPAAYAGPLNTVLTRVTQVKADTSRLQTRASQILSRTNQLSVQATETRSMLRDMVRETVATRGALEPVRDAFDNVRGMRDRFQALDFNPVELLDSPELQDAIEMIRERRETMQERLNDPYIEDFRTEFSDLLFEVRGLVAEDMGMPANMPTPLETLVERAPTTVLSLIKAATEQNIGNMRENTRVLSADMAQLKEMNLLRDFSSSAQMKAAYSRVRGDEVAFIIHRIKSRIASLTTGFKIVKEKIPNTPMRFGIHGYAQLIQIDAGNNAKKKIELTLLALERIDTRVGLVGETMKLLAD
jgi:hypothetical protein